MQRHDRPAEADKCTPTLRLRTSPSRLGTSLLRESVWLIGAASAQQLARKTVRVRRRFEFVDLHNPQTRSVPGPLAAITDAMLGEKRHHLAQATPDSCDAMSQEGTVV